MWSSELYDATKQQIVHKDVKDLDHKDGQWISCKWCKDYVVFSKQPFDEKPWSRHIRHVDHRTNRDSALRAKEQKPAKKSRSQHVATKQKSPHPTKKQTLRPKTAGHGTQRSRSVGLKDKSYDFAYGLLDAARKDAEFVCLFQQQVQTQIHHRSLPAGVHRSALPTTHQSTPLFKRQRTMPVTQSTPASGTGNPVTKLAMEVALQQQEIQQLQTSVKRLFAYSTRLANALERFDRNGRRCHQETHAPATRSVAKSTTTTKHSTALLPSRAIMYDFESDDGNEKQRQHPHTITIDDEDSDQDQEDHADDDRFVDMFEDHSQLMELN